jgi:spermidine synthase
MHLFVIGFTSILGQAVLLRELNVAFYGVDLIYALALGIWLLWTALGALIGRRNPCPSRAVTQGLFLLFAVLLIADMAFIRTIRILFSNVPGAYLPFGRQLLAMAAALLPAGLLSGLLFQRAARLYIIGSSGGGLKPAQNARRQATLATAYAVESAGGVAGGLCATLFLRLGMQNLAIALACAAVALIAVWDTRGHKRNLCRAGAALMLAVVLVMFWFIGPIDRAATAWTHPRLVASQDTPYSRVTMTEQSGQIAVYENDALDFETEGTAAEEFVTMAALMHPQPARVLILGGGIEGTVREILKHAPAQVDYVELNPALLTLIERHFPEGLRAPLHHPSVRVSIGDGRRFLTRAGNYDLILIGMPEPASGQTNRFYTREFFELCAAHLNPGGIVAFRLKSAENLWTPQQAARAASIHRSLRAALPEVCVLPGGTNVFAASRRPLARDPQLLADRLQSRRISTRLVSAPYIRYLYTNDRFAQIAHMLETAPAPPNTDVRPICFQYTLMIWLSKFYPELAFVDIHSAAAWFRSRRALAWFGVPVLAGLLLILRRRPAIRRAALAATAACAGMILETLLVLNYQVKSGVLFQDIGLLITGFMAGLALGACTTDRWIADRAHRIPLWFGLALTCGLAATSLVTGIGIRAGFFAGLWQTLGLLLATGFLTAAIFSCAALQGSPDQSKVVAPLYAADLVGGCLGSLAASLVFIPLAGSVATALAVAPLAVIAVLLWDRC